jgi:hypothetical protein
MENLEGRSYLSIRRARDDDFLAALRHGLGLENIIDVPGFVAKCVSGILFRALRCDVVVYFKACTCWHDVIYMARGILDTTYIYTYTHVVTTRDQTNRTKKKNVPKRNDGRSMLSQWWGHTHAHEPISDAYLLIIAPRNELPSRLGEVNTIDAACMRQIATWSFFFST